MSKSLKIWLWTLIVFSSLSVVGEFIFVNGMPGFLYACLSIAAIFGLAQIFKMRIEGAYAFLIIRIVETLATVIFLTVNSILATSAKALIAGMNTMGLSFTVLCIVLMVVRLITPVITVIWCKKA